MLGLSENSNLTNKWQKVFCFSINIQLCWCLSHTGHSPMLILTLSFCSDHVSR
jgi:hypothetical protein